MHPIYYVINYVTIMLNISITVFCLGVRAKSRSAVFPIGTAILVFNLAVYFHPVTAAVFQRIPVALLWFALIYFLNEGHFFSKLFIYCGTFVISLLLYLTASLVSELLFPYNSAEYMACLIVMTFCFYAGYAFLGWRYGKKLCTNLFAYAKPVVWVYYMLLPVISLIVIGYGYLDQGIIWHPFPMRQDLFYLLLPFFIFACYVLIITAILSTHSRIAAIHELELTRSIISGGQSYYERLTELTENLQKLRHDQHFQITAMQRLIDDGHSNEAMGLLKTLSEKVDVTPVYQFCHHRVLNALLCSYYDRCQKESIKFSAQIKYETEVGEYELCIIVGNLLENAITAAIKTPDKKNSYINLVIRRHDAQFGIMTQNTYDGYVNQIMGNLASTKPPSRDRPTGVGISSIKAIAKKYSGDYYPSWDDKTFSAYVVLRLDESYESQ